MNNVIDISNQSARSHASVRASKQKQSLTGPIKPSATPAEAVDASLRRLKLATAARGIFSVHPELRDVCERAARWMSEFYPGTQEGVSLLDETLAEAIDAYQALAGPNAARNQPMHAFIAKVCDKGGVLLKYTVAIRSGKGQGGNDRIVWPLLSEPLHDWLSRKNPRELEFKEIDRLRFTVSDRLFRTYFSCHIVDFHTLHQLGEGSR